MHVYSVSSRNRNAVCDLSVRSETVTCECKHAMENIRYCIKAEQIVVVGQYDGEAAPAATSCSLSGEPQPLAHLSQYRLFTVCVCCGGNKVEHSDSVSLKCV